MSELTRQQIHTWFCFFMLMASLTANAQSEPEYIPGHVLVQFTSDADVQRIPGIYKTFNGAATHLKLVKEVSGHMRIWLLAYEPGKFSHQKFLSALRKDPYIRIAQSNHSIKKRAVVPNDTGFGHQWQYVNTGAHGGTVDADIDADDAWVITTGGVTPLGDTIVVCVIDDGLDLTHSDFENNRWYNRAEIPNNNTDDDNNGYVDDHAGWNIDTNNDQVNGGGHGTPVAGIVGAKGNNNKGVSGVNWDVKLMIVRGGGNEADAIAAYSYPLQMRKMYNESNGAEGAFVVCTNASWGTDYGQPSQAPLWCAMYDTLGAYGILNAGATANNNVNIDQVGDLPTACPSDYLIAVTNCDRNDNKVNLAGYGATHIDLGAHGHAVWTCAPGNSYNGFGGTSGATPHVAGAIALLYAAPCPGFTLLAKTNPDSAAKLVKRYLLDGGDPNASLEDITVSGNRLNLKGALEMLMNNCDSGACIAPFISDISGISTDGANLEWLALSNATGFRLEYREVGTPSWISVATTAYGYSLSNLNSCTDYEVRLMTDCEAADTSGYSDVWSFRTDGCCEVPRTWQVDHITSTTAEVVWNAVTVAVSYDLRYRAAGSSAWATITELTGTTVQLTSLQECTGYEVQIRTACDTGVTAYSDSDTFNTFGCGACLEMVYCPASGGTTEEWVEHFTLNTIHHASGDNGGYGNFTGMHTDLILGQTYNVSLTPGYPPGGENWEEYFLVWIDFNHDGNFNDAGEIAFDPGHTSNTTISGTITIPLTATTGVTRLRVTMQYENPAEGCEANYNYGEVEDYCVYLIDSANSIAEPELPQFGLYPNPGNEQFTLLIDGQPAHETLQIEMTDAVGRMILQQHTQGHLTRIRTANLSNGVYLIRVRDKRRVLKTAQLVIRH